MVERVRSEKQRSLIGLMLCAAFFARSHHSIRPTTKGQLRVKIPAILTGIILFFITLNAVAFTVPETLRYELSVGGVAIGNLSLAAKDAGENMKLESTMSTLSWVSLFYEVDDHAVSTLKKSRRTGARKGFPYSPLKSRIKINERRTADVDITFDQSGKTITYADFLANDKTSFSMNDFTLDMLATLYYIRSVPLIPGKSVSLDVINNRAIRKIVVECVRRETITTQRGTFQTVVVKADVHVGVDGPGIIYYPGDVYLWLIDDERKVPIMIEKKLPLLTEGKLPGFVMEKMPDFLKEKLSAGSIKATLVSIDNAVNR
jgi:hypothetical protein